MPNQWDQKLNSMRHYDQTAKTYDTLYAEEQGTKIAAALENLRINNKAIILDAGCGTGLLFSHIAKQAKLTVGIDTSKSLLRQAKTRAKAFSNVAIIKADVDHTPFPSHIFTHTFILTLLQNMPNGTDTLEEIKRITPQNAIIIITGLKKHFTSEKLIQLLTNAELEITSLKTFEKMKDYVVICRKHL
jgi:ubiquinone/menaquinone biosynthesis C-methylase UbiE